MGKTQLKVGVIGSGQISGIYLKNMINEFDNLEVVCVASKNFEHAKKRAEEYGIEARTVDALLADPEIDMAVVLTPVGTHYELIKQALLAGKHVYTEKTMTDSPEKAAELVALAKEKGLCLGAAPDTFLGAAWQTAREAIDSGLIGEVTSFAISGNRNNDLLLSFAPFLREPGAGILYDYAVYYMTTLVSLLGPVKRAAGVIGKPYPEHVGIIPGRPEYGNPIHNPNESQVSAIIQLENGVSGTLHIDSDTEAMDQHYYAIYGTKGVLYCSDPNGFGGEVKLLHSEFNPGKPWSPAELTTLPNHFAHAENSRGIGPSEMADAILTGRPNRASAEMAYHVLEVLTVLLNGGESGSFADIASSCTKPEPLAPEG